MTRLRVLADPTPVPGWLNDSQGRRLKYLRLSVTDRCDLKCHYCMPAEGVAASPRNEILSIEELSRLVKVFQSLGVETVRITGGEPLVRKGIVDLIHSIHHDLSIHDIALTTNATALQPLALQLKTAGLRRLNISLDSLDANTFSFLTRGGNLKRVLRGVDAALQAGFEEIKTNTVVIRGHNDHEIVSIVRWAWSKGITPRFIELMPIGYGAVFGQQRVVPSEELRIRLAQELNLEKSEMKTLGRGPANYLINPINPNQRVGFISAVTENFCEQCNRVRVTAKGDIRACLASPDGLSLLPLLRSEADDIQIANAVRTSLFGKDERHGFYVSGRDEHHDVHMSRVGG
ncbi:MAG: GTP 3',8-cyclase MoaA [Myxococcota bacterium]|nr:GTP 3',8-cyclase MoaA [Myxococcota bacterium]